MQRCNDSAVHRVPECVEACERSRLGVRTWVGEEVVEHQPGQRLLHQLAVRRVEDQEAKVIETEALVRTLCPKQRKEKKRGENKVWILFFTQFKNLF